MMRGLTHISKHEIARKKLERAAAKRARRQTQTKLRKEQLLIRSQLKETV